MAKFNRKRSGSQKVKTQWNRDLMDYPQIEARITELFEKSGLEQNEEQYNGLFDTLVEMKQIKTLTTRTEDDTDTDMREKKEMLHNLYKSENADENSVDDIEGRIAEVIEDYDFYKESSGLETEEFDEIEFYVDRLSRMDSTNAELIEKFESLANGGIKENALLAKELQKNIMDFDQNIADRVREFNDDLEKFVVEYNETTNQFDIVKRETQKEMKNYGSQVKDASEKAVEIAQKTGKSFMNALTTGFGLFGGKKDKDFDGHVFAEQKKKIAYIEEIFPDLHQKLDDMSNVLSVMLKEDLEPVEHRAMILGSKCSQIEQSYREKLGAAKELQRFIEEEIMPAAQENSDNGVEYREGLQHIVKQHKNVMDLVENLEGSLSDYQMMIVEIHSLRESAQDTVIMADRIVNKEIENFRTMLNTTRTRIMDLKHKSDISDFLSYKEEVIEAFLRASETSLDFDKRRSEIGANKAKRLEAMKRIGQVVQDKETLRLENSKKQRDDIQALEDGRAQFNDTVSKAEKSQLQLEGGKPKGKSGKALTDEFKKGADNNGDEANDNTSELEALRQKARDKKKDAPEGEDKPTPKKKSSGPAPK